MEENKHQQALCYYLNSQYEKYEHLWHAGEDTSKVALKVIRYLEAKLNSIQSIITAKE